MSRAGNPYDNAHCERFIKTLKHEEIYLRCYRTMAVLMTELPHYLEVMYQGLRLHSALGYLTPDEFEAQYHLTHPEGQNAVAKRSNGQGSLHQGVTS